MKCDTTIQFAGLTGRNNHAMNESGEHGDLPATSFSEVIRDLPTAKEANLAWKNDLLGIHESTERFIALVDPDKMIRAAGGEDVDPLWHVPTDDYTIINPNDAYGPLEDALRDQELADKFTGEARLYRGGGEVHIDVLFPEKAIDYEDSRVLAGFTTGYDFFGQTTLYAVGYAQDNGCMNSIRDLTDKKVAKHTGQRHDFTEWWGDILLQIDVMTDHLTEIIEFATSADLGLHEMPFDLAEFYENLGVPTYLANVAAADARSRSDDPFDVNLWDVHSGLTYALTHEFRGGESGALTGYVQTANDLLWNPDQMVRQARTAYELRLDEGEDGGDEVDNDARARIAGWEESMAERREQFTEFENRMERVLAGENEDGDDAGVPLA